MNPCYTACWSCRFGGHSKNWHTWADPDDIEEYQREGGQDPTERQCNCFCQAGVSR